MASTHKRFKPTNLRFKGALIRNLQSSPAWSDFLRQDKSTLATIEIPAGCDGRPDLLSAQLFGTPAHWWTFCAVNNISNPLVDFEAGKVIFIPRI
jgi:hypothetical protein